VGDLAEDQVGIYLRIFRIEIITFLNLAFDWKERKVLKLERNDKKQFFAGPIGEFEEIEPFFDASRGDIMVDITNLDEWAAPDLRGVVDERRESRKVININMLFGAEKPSGFIKKFDIREKLKNKKVKLFIKRKVR